MYAEISKKAIVMNKTEAKKAGKPGTEEFNQMMGLRSAFPDFQIVVKAERAARDNYKGLTIKYMSAYIDAHDGENASENKAMLNKMQGKDADGKLNPTLAARSYGEIKMWFLEMHPEIEKLNEDVEKVLESIKNERAARRETKNAVA